MTPLLLPLILSLSLDLPSEVQRLRPTLTPSPALDAVASDILARSKARGSLPAPGPADAPAVALGRRLGFEAEPGKLLQCCIAAADNPAAAFRSLNAGPRTRAVLMTAGATHFGTARLPGPRGGVLWCVIVSQAKAAPPPPPPPPPTDALTPIEADLIARHNAERARVGIPALRPNGALQRAARAHAADMAAGGFLSHTGSDGSDVTVRVGRQGYSWAALGEL